MIRLCPFCGKWLDKAIHDGITTCANCHRIFDDSQLHRMHAAAWYCRKNQNVSVEFVREEYGLNDTQVNIIQEYVIDKSYSHDDFIKIVKTMVF